MLKRMSVVTSGLAVMLMTVAGSSAQTATQDAKAKTQSAGHKTGQAAKDAGNDVTDAAITTAVKTKFLGDTKVSGLNINVDTNNHVVTLTGTVHSAAEKAEALRLARTTSGVRRVVSKLTMDPMKTTGNDTETAAKADARDAKADAKDKAGDAKDKTKSAAKKSGDATEHAAKKTGDAAEHAAKKTGNAAKNAGHATSDGANDVGANITDASITTAVKTKLLADSKVGGMGINVDTNSHVVTLTGVVHSAAEKAEALRIARTTKGVSNVVSKLTIEPKKN